MKTNVITGSPLDLWLEMKVFSITGWQKRQAKKGIVVTADDLWARVKTYCPKNTEAEQETIYQNCIS